MPSALSLVPPLAAILLAIATRRVVPSLLAAVVIGAAMLVEPAGPVWGWPLRLAAAVVERLAASIFDPEHLLVMAFTLLIGAMVGVMHGDGRLQRVLVRLAGRAAGRRGGQMMTWLLGFGLFFDDYANSLLLGNTMRPLADRWGISRAKLAYLVDSTAAPIAGLAVISTWVAFELSVIDQGLAALPERPEASPMAVFVASIPMRFYPLVALAMVGLVAWTGRDFGPMRRAELAARAKPKGGEGPEAAGTPSRGGAARVLAPLGVCLATVVVGLWLTGPADRPEATAAGRALWRLLEGNSYVALVAGGATGLLTALAVAATGPLGRSRRVLVPALAGAWQVFPAIVILWMAWAIAALTGEDDLNTQGFLASVVEANVPGWALPTVIFLVGGATAFAIGTSFGTMGLLMPLVVPVAAASAGTGDPLAPAVLAAVGSVLAGATLGDHCSPISDTTVLSSRASGCDHMEHVRTQLPYALLAGAISVLCGTLPSGWGVSPWLTLPASMAVLVVCLRVLGTKQVSEEETPEEAPGARAGTGGMEG